MHGLIENPARFDELAANPSLARDAGEESLRWSSPIVQMARTATRTGTRQASHHADPVGMNVTTVRRTTRQPTAVQA